MRREGSNWLLCKTKQGKKCKFHQTDQAANLNLLLFVFLFFHCFLLLLLVLLVRSFRLQRPISPCLDVAYFFVIWPPPYKSASVSLDSWEHLHYVSKARLKVIFSMWIPTLKHNDIFLHTHNYDHRIKYNCLRCILHLNWYDFKLYVCNMGYAN